MLTWTMILIAVVVVLGGLFSVLVIFSLLVRRPGETSTGRSPGWNARST